LFVSEFLGEVVDHFFDSWYVAKGGTYVGDEAFPWVLLYEAQSVEGVYGVFDVVVFADFCRDKWERVT